MDDPSTNLSTVITSLTRPLSKVGFGSFHIGRIAGEKYASSGRPLPSDEDVHEILNRVLDFGITFIDTAPAYGLSEARIGKHISRRRNEYNLCTKVGELWKDGESTYDFSASSMRTSVENSLRNLQTEYLDMLLIHAPSDDLPVLHETDAVETIQTLRQEGKTRCIGFSGNTLEAQKEAIEWSDVMMIEYNASNNENESIISKTHDAGKIVLIKKAFNSGHLSSEEALTFLSPSSTLSNMLHCIVIGSTNVQRMKKNIELINAWESQE